MDRLLNPRQLADLMEVKPGTIYSWISRGIDIPYIKVAGTLRFNERSIQEWLKKKEMERKRRNFEM